MTGKEQLALWAAGESKCKNDRDECCPDFSCCVPQLQWPEEKRKKFMKAVLDGDDGTREKMLMGALGAAIVESDCAKRFKKESENHSRRSRRQ